MATIAENILSMAELVATAKRTSRLSEATIMRILDINFAMAEKSGQTFRSDDIPDNIEETDYFEGTPNADEEYPPLTPVEGDEDALDAVAPEEEA